MISPVEMVYETIRRRILDQTYVPSQTLVESSLSEEFNVSRNTVRKALMQLVNEKLVELKANKSAIVKFLTKDEALHLLEIREVLEGLIVYSASKVITKEEMKILKDNLIEMKVLLDQGKILEYSLKNDLIHEVIDNACPNREAISLLESVRLQLRSYNKRTILLSGRSEESYKEHIDLVNALEQGDSELSEKVMRKHMSNVRKTLMENYEVLF